MKKPVTSAKSPMSSSGQCPCDKLATMFPTIVEYLVTSRWEDGGTRERSTVTLFIEDGVIKLCMNDRDQDRSCYAAAKSLEEAMQALEKALREGTVEWRTWKGKRK